MNYYRIQNKNSEIGTKEVVVCSNDILTTIQKDSVVVKYSLTKRSRITSLHSNCFNNGCCSPQMYRITRSVIDRVYVLNKRSVKDLISEGADIHACNDLPLRRSVMCNYVDIAEVLLEEGCNPQVCDYFVYKYAKQRKLKRILKLLKQYNKTLTQSN